MIEPDHIPKIADIAMPSLRRSCFHSQPRADGRRKHGTAIFLRLPFEQFPTRHRNQTRPNVLLFQFALRFDDQTHFRAGRDQNDIGVAVRRFGQDIAPRFKPRLRRIGCGLKSAHPGGSGSRRLAVRGLKRNTPGVRGFVRVAGPDHDQP